jgi:hypothetical protein
VNTTKTRYSIRVTRALASAGLILLGYLAVAPTAARADIYDLDATIGTIFGYGTGVFPGPDTGLSVTGLVDLSGSGTATLTVGSDPLLFTGSCTTSTCIVSSNGFTEFGFLDITLNVGSGSLLPDSYIAADNAPGLLNGGETQYYLSGTLTDESGIGGQSPAPEPSFFGVVVLCLGSVFVVARKRRAAAKLSA